MKKELASILITNYNKEKYLKKTIQSCLNQDFRNKEVIIFDDCSSDKSITIIKKFSNIKVIKNNKKKIFIRTSQSNLWIIKNI